MHFFFLRFLANIHNAASRLVCVTLFLLCVCNSYAQQQSLSSLRWQPTNGVEGGRVSDLVSAGSILYASTDIGIFRSDDEGASWRLLPNSVINRSVRLASKGTDLYAYLFVSPVSFLPTGPYSFSSNQSDSRVLRSRDSGMTWQPVGTGVLSGITQLLTTQNAIYAVRSTRLPLVNGIADATQTIFRSADDGTTWQQLASFNNSVINWTPNGSTVFAYTASQTIAAIGQTLVAVAQGQGIMRSEDNGTTWQNVTSMPTTSYYTSVVQANNQFFITERSSSNNSTQGTRIFHSSDSGRTWLQASSPGLSTVEFSRIVTVNSVLIALESVLKLV